VIAGNAQAQAMRSGASQASTENTAKAIAEWPEGNVKLVITSAPATGVNGKPSLW